MTTSPGSAQFLAEHQEISEWFARIEQAAGNNAWVDFYVNKRNGRPHEVKVICVMKCPVASAQEQGIAPLRIGAPSIANDSNSKWQPKR